MTHDAEYCRRVAEAIQGSPRLLFLEKGDELYLLGSDKRWEPDVDWNQAMFAAGRTQLLDEYVLGFNMYCCPSEYYVSRHDACSYGYNPIATNRELTPQLLCDAILTLKGKNNDASD